jgi:hypothetical protein
MLASARRIDEALGLAEVVASGFAFEDRTDEATELARERAREAVHGVDVEKLFRPVRRKLDRSQIGGLALLLVGLLIGGIDRILVEKTLHPVTNAEVQQAAELQRAAEEAAREAKAEQKAPNPKADALVDAARRASEAAKRGDRKGAREAIEEARAAARALEADQREQANALRALRDELEGGNGGPSSRTASEALAKLMKELDPKDQEALRRAAERLDRASATASKGSSSSRDGAGSSRSNEMSRAASALAEARAAAARGDSEGAKRAMERAARELESLERGSASSKALARISDEASLLDRSMHAAMSGAPMSGGKESGGKEGASASKGSSKDGKGTSNSGDPSGQPGAGPGTSDRAGGSEQKRVKVNGDLKARTDVREGERAVSVIEGMGRGDDPRAYREIFPAYDTIVEDGLREDSVPAARRTAVRRYFSSIRPDSEETDR